MNTTSIPDEKKETEPPRQPIWRKFIKVLLPLLVLIAGIAGAAYIKDTGPEPRKRRPRKIDPMVQVLTVHPSTEQVIVQAMGTVIPAREIILKSRVSGQIISVHPEFTEGGFLKNNQEILQIDPEDYRLEVIKRESQVANANYALKLERGHQEVAKREWEMLNRGKPASPDDIELALRRPHLRKAQADLAAARAELKQAKMNLDRTKIVAPFNAIVRTKSVEQGSQVSAQDKLAELVGVDEYRIMVSIPLDRLKWLRIPRKTGEPGAKVRILYGNGSVYEREGTVIKLLSDLESEGRMARLLVSVKDPLDITEPPENHRPPLLISEYVRVEIYGTELENVFRIPRPALRDGGNVWIADPENRLRIRQAHTIWRDMETVFVRNGLHDSDRLILSDLSAPVDGMALQTTSSDQRESSEVE